MFHIKKKKKKKNPFEGTVALWRGGRAYLFYFCGLTKISVQISKLVSQESQECHGQEISQLNLKKNIAWANNSRG